MDALFSQILKTHSCTRRHTHTHTQGDSHTRRLTHTHKETHTHTQGDSHTHTRRLTHTHTSLEKVQPAAITLLLTAAAKEQQKVCIVISMILIVPSHQCIDELQARSQKSSRLTSAAFSQQEPEDVAETELQSATITRLQQPIRSHCGQKQEARSDNRSETLETIPE